MSVTVTPLAAAYLKHMGLYDDVMEAPQSPRGAELLRRAESAAAFITDKFETARRAGDLRDFNRKFKAAREARPSLAYGVFAAEFKRGLMVQFCAEIKARRARF